MNPVAKSVIRVLLVDDSPIIRLGLRSALEDHPDITICVGRGRDGRRSRG